MCCVFWAERECAVDESSKRENELSKLLQLLHDLPTELRIEYTCKTNSELRIEFWNLLNTQFLGNFYRECSALLRNGLHND